MTDQDYKTLYDFVFKMHIMDFEPDGRWGMNKYDEFFKYVENRAKIYADESKNERLPVDTQSAVNDDSVNTGMQSDETSRASVALGVFTALFRAPEGGQVECATSETSARATHEETQQYHSACVVDLDRWTFRMPCSEDRVKTLGIIGEYGFGKTWFLRMISKCQIGQEGVSVHTVGLSLKHFTFESREKKYTLQRCVVLDTAGLNSPLSFTDNQQINEISPREIDKFLYTSQNYNIDSVVPAKNTIEKRKQDEFYQDVTLQLSDFLFIVLDQITRTGVEIVKRASDALASSKSTKTLVVIHNLRNVSSAQEAVNIWNNEICRAFGGAQHDVTVERLSPSEGNPISVPDMKHRSGGINARHYLMVRDREPWAKQYNQAVVSTIHDMIGVLRSDSESYTWKSPETFGDQIGSVLKTFVSNCSGVTVPQIGEGLYGIVPKKIDHAKPLGNGHETIAMVGHSEMNSFSVKYATFESKLLAAAKSDFQADTKMRTMIKQTTGTNQNSWKLDFKAKEVVLKSGQQYCIVDIVMDGVDLEDLTLRFSNSSSAVGKCFHIVGGCGVPAEYTDYSTHPFKLENHVGESSLSRGPFSKRIDVPMDTNFDTKQWCITYDRYLRVVFELDKVQSPNIEIKGDRRRSLHSSGAA